MIEISNLRKVYPSRQGDIVALDDVSLSVAEGEIFGVIGESGAGKSTLIRCVNALERPTSGVVSVGGQVINELSPADLRRARQRIGMIFQGFNLLGSRTVAGNISLQLEVMGVPRGERKDRVRELLALVGLNERADAYPARISGGQKQRVGIARALAGSPRVLLSDESTSALDPQTTSTILDLLRSLNRQLGLTILLITHEMDVVKRICDRVAVIEGGRIIEQGRVLELAARPETRIAQAFFPGPPAADATSTAAVRAVLPVSQETDLAAVLAGLMVDFAVKPTIASGSMDTIGGQQVGQFTIDLEGERASAAAGWLHATYGAVAA